MAEINKKRRMSEKDLKDWDELYQYVKKIMGYDENQSLSSHMVLRLKGLLYNKYIETHKIKDSANYSYETVLYTFKYCYIDIQKALQKNKFRDESHKFNYILKIVEKNLNDVYLKLKERERQLKEHEKEAESFSINHDLKYKKRPKKEYNKKFEELW